MSAESLVRQLRREGIRDERVLEAVRSVPREAFVAPEYRPRAWANHPLPIGHGQTISQPYIVALMTELLDPEPGSRVLEVGTGCGYQTAILVWLDARVYTVERLEPLLQAATATLADLDLTPVAFRSGDGWRGWPAHAPFERILVTAGADQVPPRLLDQLAPGGRMVIPVGPRDIQSLLVLERDDAGQVRRREVADVRFVPLVREGTVS